MLFDLGGRRKRVVQVVFALLAAVFAITFVGFGIGSSTSGGLFDAIGIGGGSGTTDANPVYDNQIERAQEALAADPKDEKALLSLARTHYLKGQSALETNDQGQPVALTDESLSEYNEAIDAWEKYLATNPEQPDDSVAPLLAQAYQFRASSASSIQESVTLFEGAVEAAQIVADARPSAGSYSTLAQYAYLVGNTKVAEEAEKKALAETSDSTAKDQIQQQIKAAKAQGLLAEQQIKQEKQSEKASTPDEGQLQNPLQGFGSGAPAPLPGGASPTAPLPGTGAPPTAP